MLGSGYDRKGGKQVQPKPLCSLALGNKCNCDRDLGRKRGRVLGGPVRRKGLRIEGGEVAKEEKGGFGRRKE